MQNVPLSTGRTFPNRCDEGTGRRHVTFRSGGRAPRLSFAGSGTNLSRAAFPAHPLAATSTDGAAPSATT